MDRPSKPIINDFFWRYMDERFTGQDQQREALGRLTEQRFTELTNALRLAAGELERRLTDLNHAHARAVEVQHTYVLREMYEQRHRELDAKVNKVEASVSANSGRFAGLTAVVGILTTLVLGLIGFLIYTHGKLP